MNTDNKRLRRCCFTGHRPEKLLKSETDISRVEAKIKSLLRPAVASAIQDGYITFLSGMARGFDLWAADVVLEARAHNPEIHLICALPLIDFEKKWAPAEQEHYVHCPASRVYFLQVLQGNHHRLLLNTLLKYIPFRLRVPRFHQSVLFQADC